MKNLSNRQDIELLIEQFYKKAMADAQIGHFFNEVVSLNLAEHLPKICDFWEATLFYANGYSGNAMQVHKNLNALSPISAEHFDTWLALFNETVDELFEGPTALLAKTRALSIATVMKIKLMQE